MVPDRWTFKTGKDLSALITKGSSPRWQGFDYQDQGVLFVTSENVRDGFLDISNPKYLPLEFSDKETKSKLKKGDILINIVGASIGRSCMFHLENIEANINQAVCVFRPLNHDQGLFIIQYLQSPLAINKLLGQQNDGARPNLSLADIRGLEIPIPPINEIKGISQVLTLWDQAIEVTEKLIENSERQKKALMQQLLTGKKRLSGFNEDWITTSFSGLFERVKTKNTELNDNVLTISAQLGLVSQFDYFNKNVAGKNLSKYTLLQKGDFAYNKSYSAGYPMGAIKPLTLYDKGIVSSLYICFRISNPKAVLDFYRHYFEGGYLNKEIYGIAQEGARNHGLLNVSVIDFFKIRILVPPRNEQQAISDVINAAEQEVEKLRGLREGLNEEKKALMQQLLTGKRRVKIDGEIAA